MKRKAVLALVVLAAAGTIPPVATAGEPACPTGTFLAYEHVVYAAEQAPASVSLPPGPELGLGTVDEPTEGDGCQRSQKEARVLRAGDVDPGVAVAVEGRPGSVFVMGARCAGYEGDDRWRCVREPLRFRGTPYTGTRAPAGSPALPLAEALGEAELGGQSVSVVRIEGVDPAVALAVEGRPGEAFLAPDACPYERFDQAPRLDDLRRCLRGPVWLVFDPPGARVEVEVVAYPDRAVAPELAGAAVELVRLLAPGDVVPEDSSGAVQIGALSRGPLVFVVPDLEPGFYEAVVTCEACAAAHAGQTVFPAGSVAVFEQAGSSSTGRIIVVLLGSLFLVFGLAALVVWRKGWARRRPRGGAPAGS